MINTTIPDCFNVAISISNTNTYQVVLPTNKKLMVRVHHHHAHQRASFLVFVQF